MVLFVLDTLDIVEDQGNHVLLMLLLFGVVGISINVMLTQRVIRRVQQHDDLICPQCEYALIGSGAENRCPECGWAYDDEADLRKRWRHWREFTRHQLIGGYILLTFIGALLVFVICKILGVLG